MQLVNLLTLIHIIHGFTYKTYNNKIECHSKSPIVTPNSLNELRSIVNNAIISGTKVKVIGSRHSITDIICTDGVPIHLKNFKDVAFNSKQMTVTIGAGSELMDALNVLHEAGYALEHIPAFGGITIGGALAVGSHGSSLIHRNSLSEQLVALTIIDGNGKLLKIQEDDPDFDSHRVSLGLLGTIVDATFKIVKEFKMNATSYKISDDSMINHPNDIIKMVRDHDWFQFTWFPTNQGIVIFQGDYVDAQVEGNAETHVIANMPAAMSMNSKSEMEKVQTINSTTIINEMVKNQIKSLYEPRLGSSRDPIFTEGGKFKNPAIGYTYRLLASYCDECSWQTPVDQNLGMLYDENAFSIDLEKFPQIIADIHQLFASYPIPFPISGLWFRFSPPSKGELSLSQGCESFHIDWVTPMRSNQFENTTWGLPVSQALAQMLVYKYGARPHWGKNGLAYFSHDIISNRYSLHKFQTTATRYDPNGLFINRFGNRILGKGDDDYDIPNQVTHCAIQGYCFCKSDGDCANNQQCGTIMGHPVCES